MPDSPSTSRAGYRTHATRVVYENPWLRFEAHEITHPGGTPGVHGLVGVANPSAVVVLDGRELLLTRQPRYAVDEIVLEVVKGAQDENETPLACAQRETREEVGMIAARWDSLGEAYEIPSIVASRLSIFLARECTPVDTAAEDVESIAVERVPFDDALAMCIDGRIADAVSALAILRATAFLGKLPGG